MEDQATLEAIAAAETVQMLELIRQSEAAQTLQQSVRSWLTARGRKCNGYVQSGSVCMPSLLVLVQLQASHTRARAHTHTHTRVGTGGSRLLLATWSEGVAQPSSTQAQTVEA